MNHSLDPSNLPVCSYEGSDYQSSFWDKGERQYEDTVEEIALKRLLRHGGRLMLELGAGAGRNTPRYGSWERVVLLDYSRTQLLQARERLGDSPRFVYVAADVYKLPFVNGLFDGSTMIRTLHHMAEPELALKSVRRVLAPDALFILEAANKRNIKSILRYVVHRQAWNPFDHTPIEFAELNFDFHPRFIQEILKSAQFSIEKQLSVSHFRVGWLKRHVPLKVLVGLDALLQPTGSFWQYSPSIFTLARAVGDTPTAAEAGFFSCPVCHTALPEEVHNLACPGCGREWPFADGIYDFRVDAGE